MNAHAFLVALTIVLGVAAVTTIVFRRLRQPVVLGYLLAGVIVGPHVPIPLVADPEIIRTLSELGVILLIFSIGLEFSLGKLFKVGATAGLTALLETSLMVWLGFLAGQLFGWTRLESLFAGAIIAISSTTIIAKAFDEQQVRGPIRELVFGVLVVEDLIAILLMASLTAIATGAGLSASTMAATTAKLALFLVALVVVGLLVVPHAVRAVRRLGRPETTLVASVGFCFGVALLADRLGYPVALGAFIAGTLIAESGEHQEIEQLVRPVRDIFAAVFFVSVGVQIDPALIARHWVPVVVLTIVVIVGKVAGVSVGSFVTGNSVRRSVQSGMSLAQIGEFSFIIAGLGLSLRATGEFLYPVAVSVSAITTLATPLLIRASGPVANLVDRKMPRPLQTFVTLYASWIEQGRNRAADRTRGAAIRRLIRLLVLDAVLLVAVAIGTSLGLARLTALVQARTDVDLGLARAAIVAAALALGLPLVAGVVRVARRLGLTIAEGALPAAREGAADLAAAPRRALVVALQLAIVLLTGLPILAVTQPVLGGAYGPLILVLLLAGLGVAFWRGAANLQGHVKAGSQALVAALLARARAGASAVPVDAGAAGAEKAGAGASGSGTSDSVAPGGMLAQVRELLPGLGEPTPVQLDGTSPAVGRSLADLNLRGITGATVLAITRGEQGLLLPTAREILQAGDVLALAGSHDAIDSARELLTTAKGDETGAAGTPL